MNITTILCSSILMGLVSAYFANRRKRNPYFWFLMGFVFGLLGIIAFFLVSSPRERPQPEPALPSLPPQPYIEGPMDRFWYYLDGERQRQGPMSLDALTQAWKKGEVAPSTFVWHEELTAWKQLQELIKYRG